MSSDRLRDAAAHVRLTTDQYPPGVGLALADWLDAHAATGEAYRGPLPWLYDPEAVRLADLILGGAA